MPNLNDTITPDDGLVGGDDFDVQYTITGIPAGKIVTKAWMTVEANLVQKVITTTDDPAEGQIEDDNTDGAGDAVLLFRFQPSETEKLAVGWRDFDVQLLYNDGDLQTPVKGTIRAEPAVTTATS